jgi:hypothetical protein
VLVSKDLRQIWGGFFVFFWLDGIYRKNAGWCKHNKPPNIKLASLLFFVTWCIESQPHKEHFMSIHFIKEAEEANLYLFHGPMLSLDLGNKSSLYGSVVLDNNVSDPSLSSGIFAFNNNKPVASKVTSSLSTVENNFLLNMANITVEEVYPRQDEFGDPVKLQFVYSGPQKFKIGAF